MLTTLVVTGIFYINKSIATAGLPIAEQKVVKSERMHMPEINKTVKASKGHAESVSPEAYISWINDPSSGMIIENSRQAISFLTQYHPAEYEALLQEGINGLSPAKFQTAVKNKKQLQYFLFKIKTKTGQDILKEGIAQDEEYYARVQYFSFQMQQDFMLVQGTDTLPCRLFHYERNYGAAPYTTFMLGFENLVIPENVQNAERREDKTLIYDDKVFGTGTQLFKIDKTNLENIPSINLKTL